MLIGEADCTTVNQSISKKLIYVNTPDDVQESIKNSINTFNK